MNFLESFAADLYTPTTGMAMPKIDWICGIKRSTKNAYLPLVEHLIEHAHPGFISRNTKFETLNRFTAFVRNAVENIVLPGTNVSGPHLVYTAEQIVVKQDHFKSGKVEMDGTILNIYVNQTKNHGDLFKHMMNYKHISDELFSFIQLLVRTENRSETIEFGETPLHVALSKNIWGHSQLAEDLMERKVEQQVPGPHGKYPIHLVCGGHWSRTFITPQDIDLLQMLIRQGADINAVDDEGHSALHYAVTSTKSEEYEALQAVEILLQKECNPNVKDSHGSYPIHYVCGMQQNDVHNPITENDLPILKTLADKGADVNVQNSLGWTPLHVLLTTPSKNDLELEAIKILINHGADPNISSICGEYPVHLTLGLSWQQFKSAISWNIQATNILVSSGADCNVAMGELQKTVLHKLSSDTDFGKGTNKETLQGIKVQLVQLLLENKANPNQQDVQGETALHTICKMSQDSSTELKKEKIDLVQLLLYHGACPNVKDKKFKTPLHYAVNCHVPLLVDCLLRYGADHTIYDFDGKLALDLAQPGSCEAKMIIAHAKEKEKVHPLPLNLPPFADQKLFFAACRVVSVRVGYNWKMLFRNLEPYDDPRYTEPKICELQVRYPNELNEWAYHSLLEWRDSRGSTATVHALISALRNSCLVDLAEDIEKLSSSRCYSSE